MALGSLFGTILYTAKSPEMSFSVFRQKRFKNTVFCKLSSVCITNHTLSSHQTCIVDQNICSRNDLEKYRKSVLILTKKNPKIIFFTFYNTTRSISIKFVSKKSRTEPIWLKIYLKSGLEVLGSNCKDKDSAVRRAVEGSKVFLWCYFKIILAFNSHKIAPRQCAQAIILLPNAWWSTYFSIQPLTSRSD